MKSKKRKNYKDLLIEIFWLILLIAIIILVRSEMFVLFLFIILLTLNFYFQYNKGEWKLFLIGILLGIIIEVGGSSIYKMQYWISGSFFGIPLWLPILWGYSFVFIQRVGRFIVKN